MSSCLETFLCFTALGDHLNRGFLEHTAFCIAGERGRFVESYRTSRPTHPSDASRVTPLENLAQRLDFVYVLAADHAPFSSTIIPKSELASAPTDMAPSPASSSVSDLNGPVEVHGSLLAETGLNLGPYASVTFTQRHSHPQTREVALREELFAFQQPTCCRVTRKDIPELLQAAPLFKVSNPDQVSCPSLLCCCFVPADKMTSEYAPRPQYPRAAVWHSH